MGMKKTICLLAVALLTFSCLIPVFAQGNVNYEKDAGNFVFLPGSDLSATDLFTDFKSIMPGDALTQKITIKNKASNNVKVELYMRAMGAQDDASVAFLSALTLSVTPTTPGANALYEGPAHDNTGLADWVYLGTLYSGGETDLSISLKMPTELDNTYASKLGTLNWQFKVKEYPLGNREPKLPPSWPLFWAISIVVFLIIIGAVIYSVHRKKKQSA